LEAELFGSKLLPSPWATDAIGELQPDYWALSAVRLPDFPGQPYLEVVHEALESAVSSSLAPKTNFFSLEPAMLF
jgi:hypothetical protein